MNDQKASLLVSISNAEFQKDYHYFITCQLESEGEKRRTDISACVQNPVFTASTFVIPLQSQRIEISERIHFAAFVVLDRGENNYQDLNTKGQARLLGECKLDLGPSIPALMDFTGIGVRQSLKFTRISGDKEVTVGRFIVNIKLVAEQVIPITNQDDIKPIDKDDIFHDIPLSDPFFEFQWRVRVDIRCGVDLPLNRANPSGLPSSFAEVGFTLYDNQLPNSSQLFITNVVENNRHPIWNCQFLISNPDNFTRQEGFIYLCFRDQYISQPLDIVYIPIQYFKPFIPINIELESENAEYQTKAKYYISLTLEQPNQDSFVDGLVDVIVHNVHFDPLPYTTRMFVVMTLNNYNPQSLSFINVNMDNPQNIAQRIQENQLELNACFISSILKIPPYKVHQIYKAVAYFTLPRSYLSKNIQFFIAGKDDSLSCPHQMPNGISGMTLEQDDTLKKLLFAKDKKASFVPILWKKDSKLYPVFSTTKCMLELACFTQEDQKKLMQVEGLRQLEENEGQGPPKTPMDTLANYLGMKIPDNLGGKEKWAILAKELAQKQEIVHRMIKDLDDKTESLKITGTEIIELRRQIKLLQSENAILRKRLNFDEQLDVQSVVQKEIAHMNIEQMRGKIIKLATAYRDERIRNEDFEKALKKSQKDIANARQIEYEFEMLQKKQQEALRKIAAYQQEISKIGLLKETIRKQEKVIEKLEKLIENTLKDTQNARQYQLEAEKLHTENINLQKLLKNNTQVINVQENSTIPLQTLEQYKNEIFKLQKVIADLQAQLYEKNPKTVDEYEWENEKAELQVRLLKAEAKINATEEELIENAKNYAKEIAQLKLIIAEKQAMLDTLTLGI